MAVESLLATRAQRAFIITLSLQAIVVLVMVAITFRMVEDAVSFTGRYKTIPCYLALFALAEIFELLMAFDALRLRNVIQLVGILLFHMALIVMAALQVHQTRTALVQFSDAQCADPASFNSTSCAGPGSLWAKIEPFLIVVPCVIAAAWVVMFVWIKQLYAEFGWAIFHVVGANPKMKKMYQWYQIMICLLKFDFFFFAGVTMQLLIVVLSRNSAEFAITIISVPIVLILLALCAVAVQREIKSIMTVSLILMLAAETYFIYKLVRFYEPSSREQYVTTRATLTIFTIVAFLLLFSTFAVGLRCFADFDRGLLASKVHNVPKRPKYSQNMDSGNMSQRQSSNLAGFPLGPRISIE